MTDTIAGLDFDLNNDPKRFKAPYWIICLDVTWIFGVVVFAKLLLSHDDFEQQSGHGSIFLPFIIVQGGFTFSRGHLEIEVHIFILKNMDVRKIS